jgi:hypothetical protein
VAFEFSQVVAELVEAVGFFGKLEALKNNLVNVPGSPAAMEQDFKQPNDASLMDLDTGVVKFKIINIVDRADGTLAEQFLAQDWNSEDLAKEMNHLLGPRQSAQVTVDDDSIEAVVYKEQHPAEKLREQFHGNLILPGFGARREP